MSTLKTNNIQHVDRSDPSIIINTDGSVNIAGTMTYEDVTSVDAVGIITGRDNLDAQKQVLVGTGVSVKAGGINVTAGITTVQALQATTGTFSGDVDVADKIVHTGDTDTAIRFGTNTFTVETAGSERVRIDSSGRILKGITSARGNYGNNTSGVEYAIQLEGTSAIAAGLSIIRNSNDGNDGGIVLGKTRATSNGGNTVVQAGDDLGNLTFAGSDGTSLLFGAEIFAEVQSGVGNDDLPTDLIFKTNSGTTSTTERVRIKDDGKVGIGVNDPDAKLEVLEDVYVKGSSGDGSVGIQIRSGSSALSNQHQIRTGGGSGDQLFIEALGGSSAIVTKVAGSERLRIDANGRVITGHTAALTLFHGPYGTTKRNPHIQVNGTTVNSASMSLTSWDDNVVGYYGPALFLAKSGSSTIGTNSRLNNANSILGSIIFSGDDGDEFIKGAMIQGAVDGATGGNDMPGRLMFHTTLDGAQEPTERMRITQDGRVLINTTAVTNTNDFLTVKRPAGSWTEASFTLDANTSTSSAANALIFTKSKHTYWNGYAFQSSHGYIGALLGKRDSAGTSDQEIRLEIGGDSPNQNEEKTWTFRNSGNLALSAGNIEFASGYGIDFSATSNSGGSMTSELLDDYEEGTFTPAFAYGLVASSYESNGQKGAYTKIGRFVYGTIILHLATASTQDGNVIDIHGLPFDGMNHSGGQSGGLNNFYQDGFFNSNDFSGIVKSANNQVRLYVKSTGAYLTGTSVNGGKEIRCQFWYQTA